MHREVRDALFGFAVGTAVRIRTPGGTTRLVELRAGHSVTLTDMPRATYELVAEGPGFGLSSPATLTKPLVARLLLLSWTDITAVAAFAVLFLVGLPLVGGRIVRRKDGRRLPGWHSGRPQDPPSASGQDLAGAPDSADEAVVATASEPADAGGAGPGGTTREEPPQAPSPAPASEPPRNPEPPPPSEGTGAIPMSP